MSNPPHSMELPRKILIGEGVISRLGSFIMDINDKVKKVSLISGSVVRSRSGEVCSNILKECRIANTWHIAPSATIDAVIKLQHEIEVNSPDFLIGIGGGRSVDLAKMISFRLKLPFIS